MQSSGIKLALLAFCVFSGIALTLSVPQAAAMSSLLYGGSEAVNYFVSAAATATGTFTVTPSAGPGGSITPSASQTVSAGATTTFTVTPNAGYTAFVGGTCGGSLNGLIYTTNAITANCTVVASFAQNTEQTSNCTATVESREGKIFLSVPIIAANSSNGTAYYYADFSFEPVNDKIIFKLTTKAGLLTDTSPYTSCQHSTLSPFGNDFLMHLAKVNYNGSSIWINLKYLQSSDGALRFEATNYGSN